MSKVYIVPDGSIVLQDENTALIGFRAQAGVVGAADIGFTVPIDFGDGANLINNKIRDAVVTEYALLGVTIAPTDKKILIGSATVL